MAEGDTPRDPAAPLPAAPQHTAPLGAPWAFPHFSQPGPVVDLKKATPWLEIWKFVFAALTAVFLVGGIVFAAGQLVGEFRSFKLAVGLRLDASDVVTKKTADDAAKANASSAAALLRVDDLNAKLERLNITKRNRPRREDP
jgi:hypothetical protein